MGDEPERAQPLIRKGFEYDKRPYNDVCFTVFYSVLMVFATAVAIFAAVEMNEDWYQLYEQNYVFDEGYCTVKTTSTKLSEDVQAVGSDTLLALRNNDDVGDFIRFLKHSWPWIVGAAGGSIVLGFVFLLLFSYFAMGMVYITVSLIVIVPAGIGAYQLIIGKWITGGILIAIALVLVLLFMCLRSKLNLVAKLLDVGADGVRENLQLIGFTLLSMISVLIVLCILVFFGGLAATNGKFRRNPDNSGFNPAGPYCFSVDNLTQKQVPCCEWHADKWTIPYYVLIVFLLLWNIFLMSQLRVFVVSGVIAQWYFADEGDIYVRGKTRRSLRHALGPSFGSICISSMLLTIGKLLRMAAEKMKRDHKESCFWWMVNCCAQAIISFLEWITEFATVHMAITGESFWESGKDAVEMLKRNFINAYTVWWFPPIILGLTGFIISGSVSAALGGGAYALWDDADLEKVRTKWAVYTGVIAFLLMIIVLVFFSTILLDTVSAVFVCFAIDKDNSQETNSKVHSIMGLLPSVPGITAESATRDRGLPTDAPTPIV